jgi:hypothetical protein
MDTRLQCVLTIFTAILNSPSAIIGSASTIFTLTYKIPLSYTPTVEKAILINCRQGEVERVKEVFDERVQRV